jgi:hypothetical protein
MRLVHGALLVAGAVGLAGCGEDGAGPTAAPAVGRLRLVHASPDTARAKTVDVQVAGVPVAAAMAYKAATSYVLVLEGQREVVVRNAVDSTTVFSLTLAVSASTDYTVLSTGIGSDLSPLTVVDTNAAPVGDSVKIRVVLAAPAAGNVDVYITTPTASLTAETPDASNVPFRAASGYFTLGVGAHRVRLTPTGTKTVSLDVSTPSLAKGQIRTVVALDKAGGGAPLTSATLADR